ncbi:MAG: DASS family sodium-coupled anion symporter [Veillonellales bacterium]
MATEKNDNQEIVKFADFSQMRSRLTPQEEKFEIRRRTIGFILGPSLALAVYFTPFDGLQFEAHVLLSIMTLVAAWWMTEPLPIPVTSTLGPVLAVMAGIVSPKEAFAPFADPLIFLFMGSFLLAQAMMVHGLDKRFAYSILSMKWVGSSPKRILLALGLVTCFLSGWVSNTATTAMMFPIAMGLLYAIKDMHEAAGKKIDLATYKYATGIMLMAAYAASVGGVLTPIGTPPNLIVVGLLDKLAGVKISFFQWMSWGIFATVFYFGLVYIVLNRMFPADVSNIEGADKFIKARRDSLGPWKQGERNAIIAFSVAIILWLAPGIISILYGTDAPLLKIFEKHFSEATAAMFAGLLLFILPVDWKNRKFTLSWKDANEGIDWGTLLLFGGGLSLGVLMYKTGLSLYIGNVIVAATGANSLVVMVAVFAILALVMSELTSHTAATNMLAPLGITTALSAGIDPVPVAVAVALSSSLGFMLPVSTPPNAIVYGSGLIPITKMIRTGVIIDVIGILAFTIPLVIFIVRWLI